MDEDFIDLIDHVKGISKRLDDLNADFFTKIFTEIMDQAVKREGGSQTEKFISHLENLKNEIKDLQHCHHNTNTAEVQTENSF
jgi:hypothetical protein